MSGAAPAQSSPQLDGGRDARDRQVGRQLTRIADFYGFKRFHHQRTVQPLPGDPHIKQRWLKCVYELLRLRFC